MNTKRLGSRPKRGSITLIETAIITTTVGLVILTASDYLKPALSDKFEVNSCSLKNHDLLDPAWDSDTDCLD